MALLGFKRFTRVTRSGKPLCIIRKCGQICFNAGAVAKYDLDIYDYAVLYISDDRRRFAVQFVLNEKEEGAKRVQKRKGCWAISAIPFMRLFEIDFSKTTNYEIKWIDKERTAVMHLNSDGGEEK